MKYYYRLNEDIILSLGRSNIIPEDGIEISEEDYTTYRNILSEVPSKDGYLKKTTLHINGMYEVNYTPIEDEGDR